MWRSVSRGALVATRQKVLILLAAQDGWFTCPTFKKP